MTTDLFYLTLLAGLGLVLWIPHVIAIVLNHGFMSAGDYREIPEKELPAWGRRAKRSHINFVENFAPFAALVIVAHLTKTANETTALMAMLYFWIRVAHAAVFYLGVPFARTLVFTAGVVVNVVLFLQIVT
ncbi:MAG TPA: MAPEG family protein [Alphaproteobacteria bacterium]|nr:MAPEG family protein [Alphaproteobacteria bacterium]